MNPAAKQIRPCRNTLIIAARALCLFTLLSSLGVQAQIKDRPKAGPDQKRLEVNVGKWEYTGTLRDTPLGPGGKFAGTITSRMILDGLFLESRNEDKGTYGGEEVTYKGLILRWFDSTTKTYLSQTFDNDGMVERGSSTVNGNTWTSVGSGIDSKGKAYQYRVATTFSRDGKSHTTKAELSVDGEKTWMPYWEWTAKKVANEVIGL